jgi:nifR3 family TIM-barrel protein
MNFWQQLTAPFLVVAPMADVTDAAFRRLIAKYSAHTRVDGTVGGPAVMWTEFVAADGLVRATEQGRQKLMADLLYDETERPIVAQLFSATPRHMEYAARLCRELGFDGVDINMGCPDRAIEKQGCGAAMIKHPSLAREIIEAAKRGAGSTSGGIPVSVKTRLGYTSDEVETWIATLLKESPAALTVHARTRKDMSSVPARWERVARVVELRNELSPSTRVIGNGDVLSPEDAMHKISVSGADGAMVGRALFGNPWFFHPHYRVPYQLHALPTKGVDRETLLTHDQTRTDVQYVTIPDRLRVLIEHSELFLTLLPHKSFAVMKKHYKAYVQGFPGAAHLRAALMGAPDVAEVRQVVHDFLKNHSHCTD